MLASGNCRTGYANDMTVCSLARVLGTGDADSRAPGRHLRYVESGRVEEDPAGLR